MVAYLRAGLAFSFVRGNKPEDKDMAQSANFQRDEDYTYLATHLNNEAIFTLHCLASLGEGTDWTEKAMKY